MKSLETEYILDPRADVKLVLRRPRHQENGSANGPANEEEEDRMETDELSGDPVGNEGESHQQGHASTNVHDHDTEMTSTEDEDDEDATMRTLRAPVFRAMFEGAFRENLELSNGSPLPVNLPEDDPDAFLIVLNIILGRIDRFLARYL
ncbi:hypothetical protein VTN77DRAFT_7255 [Rasamsonia byssochlamydoides]|uniref:uncharacterized protein n=1 Tax=Rasamsonia byssochlamydoides TaxID=89139 RepID=UPI00374477E3